MEQAIELYKKYTPIKEILKETGLTKPTLYRILKRHGLTRTLSESAQNKNLSESHKQNISKALRGKFLGKDRWTTINLKENHQIISTNLAYIIGVMYGDGYIYKAGGIGLESIDEDFVKTFANSIETQFGLKGHFYKYEKTNLHDWRNGNNYNRRPTTTVKFSSVLLRDFIEKIKSFSFVDKLNKEQKIAFLRGLWDSEGSVFSSNRMNGVEFVHNTFELCELFRKTLLEITGIESKISKKPQGNHKLYFYRKEYIKTFYEIIQPTIQRKRDKFEDIIHRFK